LPLRKSDRAHRQRPIISVPAPQAAHRSPAKPGCRLPNDIKDRRRLFAAVTRRREIESPSIEFAAFMREVAAEHQIGVADRAGVL
jgi:hypothetical protein